MSGIAVATPQSPGARVPTGVLLRFYSGDERIVVETVVQRVERCVVIRIAECNPAGFNICIASDSARSYICKLCCQNETRGGGGVHATRDDDWQRVYVAFAPISFLDKCRRDRVSRAPLRVGGTDAPMG
ncbi:hypothetical protein N9L68_07145 [bacterium]|nr:hypothetical protein [bacterium]